MIHSSTSYLKKMLFDRVVRISVGLFFLVFSSAAVADGPADFRAGREDLQAGRYADAAAKFGLAAETLPVLADYALFYSSEAYQKAGEHGRALDAVRSLLKRYPHTCILKKARLLELKEAEAVGEKNLSALFERYVNDYSDDDETALRYASFLKGNGDPARAKSMFRNLYVQAGSVSASAFAEIGPKDLTAKDLIERAFNQSRRYEFKGAERDLRKALTLDDGRLRERIEKDLAGALFKQKEYREAAAVYDRVGDLYSKARSLYRAGDKEGFESALTDVVAKDGRRAGPLLLAAASDKRREGRFEEAVRIYEDTIKLHPSEAEDALWGMGWTYYLSADYKKAADVFSKLYAKSKDPKYLYWQARSREASKEAADDLYKSLGDFENNFYSFLAALRTGGSAAKPLKVVAETADLPDESVRRFERTDMLMLLGLQKEAVAELSCMVKKAESQADMLAFISKFQELGEYRRSIGLATKLPYSEKLYRFWYPQAFREDVDAISRQHSVDPSLVLSVMREESRFDWEARSVAGARGLMQIMPQTAFRLDKVLRLGISREFQINDIRNNISLGAYYLKNLFNEFRSLPHVLAAYNAGEAAVRRWEREGRYSHIDEFIEDIPYQETRDYVKKVTTSYLQYRRFYSPDSLPSAIDSFLGRL